MLFCQIAAKHEFENVKNADTSTHSPKAPPMRTEYDGIFACNIRPFFQLIRCKISAHNRSK